MEINPALLRTRTGCCLPALSPEPPLLPSHVANLLLALTFFVSLSV